MRLLLASYYYPPSIGGVEQQTHLLARGLVQRGHAVRVITARLPGTAAREVLDGVQVQRVSPGRGSRWQKMATYCTGLLWAVMQNHAWADILQVQQILYPAAAVAVVQPLLQRPLVVRNAGSGAYGGVQLMRRVPFGNVALKLIARTATGVSLNAEMTSEMRDAGFRRLVEIPNGVEIPPAISPAERGHARTTLRVDGPLALYVGRLEAEKGVDVLIRSWPYVSVEHAQLLIVGDGPERQSLEHLTRELGCDPSIRFVGATRDVRRYFAATDLLVLPSRSEGISNTLLEALATGLAVIATAVGGNRQVLECSTLGRLVPPDEPRALATAVRESLIQPGCRLEIGAAARRHVAERYSVGTMLDAYQDLYGALGPTP